MDSLPASFDVAILANFCHLIGDYAAMMVQRFRKCCAPTGCF